MKIKFLGTAASEGFPGLFCNCDYCNKARELKGKNIRTRHQSIINDDLVIDFPCDAYLHVIRDGLRMDKVKAMLITHSHGDHFNPKEFRYATTPYAHNQEVDVLNIYSGKGVQDVYIQTNGDYNVNNYQDKIKFNLIENFKPTLIAGGYLVTALPARHQANTDAKIYIIEKDNKRILYAHDTGLFFDEVFDYIGKNKITFDLITLDCTNVTVEWPDDVAHMGFCQIVKVIKRLTDLGAISDKTIKYVSHFSHNGNALQDYIEGVAKPYGINVAFDGEEVEF